MGFRLLQNSRDNTKVKIRKQKRQNELKLTIVLTLVDVNNGSDTSYTLHRKHITTKIELKPSSQLPLRLK